MDRTFMADSTKSGSAARAIAARKPSRSVWQKKFIEELANTSNVSAAARAAKVCTSTAYEARRSDAEFNRKWQVALCEGYDNLEMDLLHRLPTRFLRDVRRTYGKSLLARQELDGEMIEDLPGALWTRGLIEECREPVASSPPVRT